VSPAFIIKMRDYYRSGKSLIRRYSLQVHHPNMLPSMKNPNNTSAPIMLFPIKRNIATMTPIVISMCLPCSAATSFRSFCISSFIQQFASVIIDSVDIIILSGHLDSIIALSNAFSLTTHLCKIG